MHACVLLLGQAIGGVGVEVGGVPEPAVENNKR